MTGKYSVGPTPVGDRLRAQTVPSKRRPPPLVDEWDEAWLESAERLDAATDLDLENPESCESCQ